MSEQVWEPKVGDRVGRIKAIDTGTHNWICYRKDAAGTITAIEFAGDNIRVKMDNCNCGAPQLVHGVGRVDLLRERFYLLPNTKSPQQKTSQCIYAGQGLPVAEVEPEEMHLDKRYESTNTQNKVYKTAKKKLISHCVNRLTHIPFCTFTNTIVEIDFKEEVINHKHCLRAILVCKECGKNNKKEDDDVPF